MKKNYIYQITFITVPDNMLKNITLIIIALSLLFLFLYFVDFPNGLKPIITVIAISITLIIPCIIYLPKDNDYIKNIILVVGLCLTIISWFVVGYLNSENDRKRSIAEFERSTKQAKRDLKVKILMDAYFRLANSDGRETPKGVKEERYSSLYSKYSESALTSVQLLGKDSTVT